MCSASPSESPDTPPIAFLPVTYPKTHLSTSCLDTSITTYTRLEKIGSGSFGTVWKARDSNNQLVAIKKIQIFSNDPVPASTLIEASTLMSLDSKYILKAHKVINSGNGLELVTELMDGNLVDYMTGSVDIMNTFRDIAHGLMDLHRVNLIHTDLKPLNVLFRRCSNMMTLDIIEFKISDLDCRFETTRRISRDYSTLHYRAPELLRQQYKRHLPKMAEMTNGLWLSPSADIWSLGCILYELIAGKFLFPETNPIPLADAIWKLHLASTSNDEFVKFLKKDREVTWETYNEWPMYLNLLKGMLKVNPRERLTIFEITEMIGIAPRVSLKGEVLETLVPRKWRSTLIDWLNEVRLEMKLDLGVFLVCVDIHDMVVQKFSVPTKLYQCLGTACMLLAAKLFFFEMKKEKLVRLGDGSFTFSELCRMEKLVVEGLGYKMYRGEMSLLHRRDEIDIIKTVINKN